MAWVAAGAVADLKTHPGQLGRQRQLIRDHGFRRKQQAEHTQNRTWSGTGNEAARIGDGAIRRETARSFGLARGFDGSTDLRKGDGLRGQTPIRQERSTWPGSRRRRRP